MVGHLTWSFSSLESIAELGTLSIEEPGAFDEIERLLQYLELDATRLMACLMCEYGYLPFYFFIIFFKLNYNFRPIYIN